MAGSDAAAGTSPAAKARKISHPNKKAKPGEAKVLWSPSKAGGGESVAAGSSIYDGAGDGGAGAGGTGAGGNSIVAKNNLTSLATSFKERYGEHVGFDEEEAEGRGPGGTGATQQTARRKRSLSGGAGTASAEETARSMSPSKLATEMQKARARAREERFGTGSFASRPPALTRRKPAIGKISVQQALPSAQAHAGNVNGRAVDDGNRSSVHRISPTPSPPPEASALLLKVPPPAKTKGVTAVTKVLASASASGTGTVVDATRVAEANGLHRQSLASPAAGASVDLPPVALTPSTPTSSAPASVPIVTALDIGEDGPSALGASERFVTVVEEVSPVDAAAKMSPRKRPAPESGDIVIIEPPTITAGASSPVPAQGDAAKVHTLRLRLRTDLPGGEQTRFGGVEESKSFEPPNSPVDGGVEECKGFDPPNLPPTPQKQQPQQKRQPTSSPSTTVSPPTVSSSDQGKPPQPPLASAVSNPGATRKPSPSPAAATSPSISRSKSSDEVAQAVVLSRENSWGPSFGIAVTMETAAPAAATAAPTALPKTVADPRKNPWVLSPDAPTFAKNRGRPLARSFSQPTSDTDAANGGVGKDENLGLGRDRGTARGPGVAGSAVGSSGDGGGGGREEGGASGHDRRRASRPTDTTLVARPPSAAAAATPAAVGGGAAATAASAAAAATDDAVVCVKAENESGVQRVAQTVLAGSESNLRSTGGEGGVSRRAATRTEGERGAASVAEGPTPDDRPDESVLGVRVGRRAGELLERLKREREESLDFERKLTQALLDL